MFFIGLTMCLISWIAGAILIIREMTLYGIGLVVFGFILSTSMIIYYKSRVKGRENSKGNRGSNLLLDCLPDCNGKGKTDCDATPDCDCSPDCSP